MLVPLVLLAVGAVCAGYLWFYPTPLSPIPNLAHELMGGEGHNFAMMGGIAVFVVGVVLGFLIYRPGAKTDALETRLPLVYRVLEKRLYIDTLYDWYVAKVQQRFAMLLNFLDQIFVAGLAVRGTAGLVGLMGLATRALHVGSLHAYVYWFLFGLVVLWGFATGLF
jgi:NADH-quinone oxidoreductase subunit L